MKDYATTFTDLAATVLQPGERMLTAIRTEPPASSGSMASALAGGLVGAAAHESGVRPDRLTPEALHRAVLALTDRRLLIWQRRMVGTRPGRFLGFFPLQALAGVSARRGRLSHQLDLAFADGTRVALRVFFRDDVERFAAALHSLRRA